MARSLKVHEVIWVSPPQGTTPTSLPLTFFDLLWLRLPPTERLYFYHFPNPTTTPSSFFDSVLPNLKRSLELTLAHFVPLAGNVTWPVDSPIPIITYNPAVDSVPFTVAESTDDFNVLSSNLCETSRRHPLVPRLKNMSHENASLLALQVTLFPNAGFCVGITTHHAAVDGKSSTLFMKSWSHLCSQISRGEQNLTLPENLTPSFERSVIKDPKGLTQIYADTWQSMNGPNNRSLLVSETIGKEMQNDAVKGVFELTPSQIQTLKRNARQSKGNKVDKVSTFAVSCAYLVWCLVKTEQPESMGFIFNVDCRPRLDPPVTAAYLGNCIVCRLLLDETERVIGSDGFVNVVEGIVELLNGLEKGVLDDAENWGTKSQSALGHGRRLYSPSGSTRFGVYGIDFGWGRPKKVDVASVDRTGGFSLSETRDVDGGVEIGLALKRDHMEAFKLLFAQGIDESV